MFAHLVTPERMVRWMGERANLEPHPGGTFAVDVRGVPFRGQYLEVEPPRRVVVSWGMAGSDDFPAGISQVEFILTPTAQGTSLQLHHTGLPETRAANHSAGWQHYLDRLQRAATGLDPGTDLFEPPRRTHT